MSSASFNWSLIHKYGKNFPAVGAEIGVHYGVNAELLLGTINHCMLFLIDPWCESSYLKWTDKIESPGGIEGLEEGFNRVKSVLGNRHNVKILKMESVEASLLFVDKCLDYVYIDAAHSYKASYADIRAWIPKVKAGGTLGGHDYDWPGVKEAVDEYIAEYGKKLFLGEGDYGWWFDV
jgi:hypothetical protein